MASSTKEYVAARRSELRKIDHDAQQSRIANRATPEGWNAAFVSMNRPEEGALLNRDGCVVVEPEGDNKEKNSELPTTLVGIRSLEAQIPMILDSAGMAFTIRDLSATSATPDVAIGTEHRNRDFGQGLDHEWFHASGGVTRFANLIRTDRRNAAELASKVGTRLPTGTSKAEPTPQSAFATWHLHKLQHELEEAEAIADGKSKTASSDVLTNRKRLAVAKQELVLTEMLSERSRSTTFETNEVLPVHIAYYLFEPANNERPCVNGERCMAFTTLPHPLSYREGRRLGVVLKEFLTESERDMQQRYGTLPRERKQCIICMRAQTTFAYFQAKLDDSKGIAPTHYHPIDLPGGYRHAACLRPRREGSSGVCVPTRPFVTNDYAATTLTEAVRAKIINLSSAEIDQIRREWNAMPGQSEPTTGVAPLRGYVELGHVFYAETTRDASPQALRSGSEPGMSYTMALGLAYGSTSHDNTCDVVSKYMDGTLTLSPKNRILCAEPGEHAGSWQHLVFECSARLAVTPETASVLFGPFGDTCKVVAAVLTANETNDDGPSNKHHQELLALIDNLRCWRRVPQPQPLSGHSVLVSCLLRSEIAEDLRSSVASDAVTIARAKADNKRRLVRRDAPNKEAADVAVRRFDKTLKPFPALTPAQEAVATRIANVEPSSPLGCIIAEKNLKKLFQKTLDRVLQVVSEFDASLRPLRRALVWARDNSLPLDDAALLGVESTAATTAFRRQPSLSASAFGSTHPDAGTPKLHVPRRPPKLSLAASATALLHAGEVRFAVSGLPVRSRLPYPAPFLMPDVPRCRIRFPTHRDVLSRHVDPTRTSVLSKLRDVDLLDEFWRVAALVRLSGHDTERALLTLGRCPGVRFLKSDDRSSRSIVAAAFARATLGDRMSRETSDDVLSLHAYAFALTHVDLLAAIDDWEDTSRWTDAYLTKHTSIANDCYPYDRRVLTEEDMPSISNELTNCDFFQQSADGDNNKTLEHVVKKVVRRACERRACDVIMDKTTNSCAAFSAWLLAVLRCFIIGCYAHARQRPPFVLLLFRYQETIREIQREMDLRISEADKRPLAEERLRESEDIERTLDAFGPQQFWGLLDVARHVSMAGTVVSMVLDRDAEDGGFEASSFFSVARGMREISVECVVSDAVKHLDVSPNVSEAVRSREFSRSMLEQLDGHRRQLLDATTAACRAVGITSNAIPIVYRAIADSVRVLGMGGLSSSSLTVAREAASAIALEVTNHLRAVYRRVRQMAGVRIALATPDDFLDGLERRMVKCLVRLSESGEIVNPHERAAEGGRIGPLSYEAMQETCTQTTASALSAMLVTDGRRFMPDVRHGGAKSASELFCRTMIGETLRATETVDSALVSGIAAHTLTIVSGWAGDASDVYESATRACIDPKDRQAVVWMLRAVAKLTQTFRRDDGEDKDLDQCAAFVGSVLSKAMRSRQAMTLLASENTTTISAAAELLCMIGTLRASVPTWGQRTPEGEPEVRLVPPSVHVERRVTPDEVARLAGRLAAEVLNVINPLMASIARFEDAVRSCETLRRPWQEHRRVSRTLADTVPFVVRNATFCQYAVREAVTVQMSRNPALVATFATCGAWFPDFVRDTVRICDSIRAEMMTTEGRIPTEERVSVIETGVACRAWWACKVYRLNKLNFFTRILKTAEQQEATIAHNNFKVGPAFRIDRDRILQMRAHIFGEVAACGGGELRPNLSRDLRVLWMYGMRERGLAIITRLHDAYKRFAGRNEFARIMSQFSVAEFILVMEYYRAVTSANSVIVYPLLSPRMSEATIAALCERYGYGDGQMPKELLELVVCDNCLSVHTQLAPPRSIHSSKLTSCYAVVAGPDGELVCLDKRNTVKRRAGGKRKQLKAAQERRQEGVSTPADESLSVIEESLRLRLQCQETLVRQIPGVGSVIDFTQKYIARGEDSSDARLPIVLTPCCGTWRRFSYSDWGPDGYRCLACSFARKTGPALPSVCAICGKENKAFDRTRVNKTEAAQSSIRSTDRHHQKTKSIVTQATISGDSRDPLATWTDPNVSFLVLPADVDEKTKSTKLIVDDVADDDESKLHCGKKRHIAETDELPFVKSSKGYDLGLPSGGSRCCVPSGSQHTIYVIDDDVTYMVTPIGICRACFFEVTRLGRSRVLLLTRLRELVIERRQEQSMRQALVKQGLTRPIRTRGRNAI